MLPLRTVVCHEEKHVQQMCYVNHNPNRRQNMPVFKVRRGIMAVFKWETLPVDTTKWVVTHVPGKN